MPVFLLKLFQTKISSQLFIVLALGSFSGFLVTQGKMEAAMGGVGVAVGVATMRTNEDKYMEENKDPKENTNNELLIQNQLLMQKLDMQEKHFLLSQENAILKIKLKMQEEKINLIYQGNENNQELEEMKHELGAINHSPDSKRISWESQNLEFNEFNTGDIERNA